jgi:hypothetical protein
MTRISVGDKMPGAKPSAAAALARTAVAEAGSSRISGDPRRRSRAPQAAASRPAVHAATTSTATGRATASRATASRSDAGSRLLAPGRPNRAGTGRNSRPPNTAISAWPSVIDTAIAVSTVSASPGPNALSTCVLATASEAVAAATMRPAAMMIGVTSAVASRAARTRGTPPASRPRMPSRKNTV